MLSIEDLTLKLTVVSCSLQDFKTSNQFVTTIEKFGHGSLWTGGAEDALEVGWLSSWSDASRGPRSLPGYHCADALLRALALPHVNSHASFWELGHSLTELPMSSPSRHTPDGPLGCGRQSGSFSSPWCIHGASMPQIFNVNLVFIIPGKLGFCSVSKTFRNSNC